MNGLTIVRLGFASLAAAALIAPASAQVAPDSADKKSAPRVAIEIEQGGKVWGSIVVELDAEKAPMTVRNFLAYVDKEFYDGLIFHRVIPDFMIQGGGYTPDFKKRVTGIMKPIRNEAKNGLKNVRGTIAMARTGDPHSATAQFFINVEDNANLDPSEPDGWGYCVFGNIVEGMEIVDKIRDLPTRPNRKIGGQPAPLDPPVIKKARRVQSDADKKPDAAKKPKTKDK